MDVSVVIVSWNTCEILRQCLKSVFAETKGISFEVVVIDNNSQDGSTDMVASEFGQVRLIRNECNVGFAAANNQGMAIVKGRYVLLLNSDTVVLDDAISRIVSFADVCPDTAVVGCRVLNPDRSLQPTCFMFQSLLNMVLAVTYLYKFFPRSRFFGRQHMTWWDRDDVRPVDVVTGCFMLVRAEAIAVTGKMDERFFVYGEEADWCYRFKQNGWKVMFTPNAEIIHYGGQSSAKARGKMLVQLRMSILHFMSKHHNRFVLRIACLLTAMFLALRVPVWLIRAIRPDARQTSMVRVSAYLEGIKKSLLFRAEPTS